MKIPALLTHCTLLLTTSSISAYPQCDISESTQVAFRRNHRHQRFRTGPVAPREITPSHTEFWKALSDRSITYDDILELIDEIESGTIEDYSPEEVDRINQFIAILAQQGILPHETDQSIAILNDDIQNLLIPASQSIFNCGYVLDGEYVAIPGVFYGSQDLTLCKNWFSKAWNKTRDFVKHHKKEILIGAAVVVAIAVVVTAVVMTCGAASGGAAALAGAAGGASQSGSNDESTIEQDPSQSQEITSSEKKQIIPVITSLPTTPLLQEAIEDKISSFKETISESIVSGESQVAAIDSPFFLEQARNLGAYLAHETLDGVAGLTSEIPKLLQEITNLSERILPAPAYSERYLEGPGPVEFFESKVTSGH